MVEETRNRLVGYFYDSFEISASSLVGLPPNPLPAMTFGAAIIMTGRVAVMYFHKEKKFSYGEVAIAATCWIGHDLTKKKIVITLLKQEREGLQDALTRSEELLREEKALLEEEQGLNNDLKLEARKLEGEVRGLKEGNKKLKETGDKVGKAAAALGAAVEDQRETVEKEREIVEIESESRKALRLELARLRGMLKVAREEQAEVEEGVEASKKKELLIEENIAAMMRRTEALTGLLEEQTAKLIKVSRELGEQFLPEE